VLTRVCPKWLKYGLVKPGPHGERLHLEKPEEGSQILHRVLDRSTGYAPSPFANDFGCGLELLCGRVSNPVCYTVAVNRP